MFTLSMILNTLKVYLFSISLQTSSGTCIYNLLLKKLKNVSAHYVAPRITWHILSTKKSQNRPIMEYCGIFGMELINTEITDYWLRLQIIDRVNNRLFGWKIFLICSCQSFPYSSVHDKYFEDFHLFVPLVQTFTTGTVYINLENFKWEIKCYLYLLLT